MGPGQLRTQCVRFWIDQIELPHHFQRALRVPSAKFHAQLLAQLGEGPLAVSCPLLAPLLFAHDALANRPIGPHHLSVDGRGGAPLPLCDDRAYVSQQTRILALGRH